MEFEEMMKKILVSGLPVCNRKCVAPEDRDYLNNFEKNCVGKCTEKYVEVYLKAQGLIAAALP